MRRRLGELFPHLFDILLVTLLDLFAKQLLERSVAQSFFPFLREVRDDVGDECARETLRLDVRIVREERIN